MVQVRTWIVEMAPAGTNLEQESGSKCTQIGKLGQEAIRTEVQYDRSVSLIQWRHSSKDVIRWNSVGQFDERDIYVAHQILKLRFRTNRWAKFSTLKANKN